MYYNDRNRTLAFDLSEINERTYQHLLTRAMGSTSADGRYVEVPEICWLEAREVLRYAKSDTSKFSTWLESAGRVPGQNWRQDYPMLKHPTCTGTELKDFQKQGAAALAARDLILADEQGTGKTLQTLMARELLVKTQQKGWRMIVICPNEDVCWEWARMAGQHFGELVYVIQKRSELNDPLLHSTGIWAIPITRFWRDGFLETLTKTLAPGLAVLVCDEAHMMSGMTSNQHIHFRNLRRFAYRTWMLTGTEVRNQPDGYWAMYTLSTRSNILPTEWDCYFSRGLFEPDGKRPRWCPDRLSSLQQIRGLYALRRLKRDVSPELPPIVGPIPVMVPMTAAHRKHYVDLFNNKRTEYEDSLAGLSEVTIDSHWARNIRLFQVATNPLLLNIPNAPPTHKLDRLVSLITDAGDQKVLVWSNFPGNCDWLRDQLRLRFGTSKRVESVHGGVDRGDRRGLLEECQAGKVDVVIANPMVWAAGITLLPFTVHVHWDLHPARDRWMQTFDRSHRPGQHLVVTVYALIHEDTLEPNTFEWLGKKGEWSDLITGDPKKPKPAVKTLPVWLKRIR